MSRRQPAAALGEQGVVAAGQLHDEAVRVGRGRALRGNVSVNADEDLHHQHIDAEFSRLRDLGIVFVQAPTPAGEVKVAVLNDTCGNLIQLVETPPDG